MREAIQRWAVKRMVNVARAFLGWTSSTARASAACLFSRMRSFTSSRYQSQSESQKKSRAAVAAYFGAADVALVTSDFESGPLTVKEAVASARPVVMRVRRSASPS